MALGVAANTIGKVIASTVFMCVCSMFRPSDFLLFVKNGFVVGARTLNVTAGHCKSGGGIERERKGAWEQGRGKT